MSFLSKKDNFNINLLYSKIILLSRNKYFYTKAYLIDKYQNRVNLIFLHICFLIIKFKIKENNETKQFLQKFFDFTFLSIEQEMRELGYGDVGVNKNMKLLVKIFYNILFDCEIYIKLNNEKKASIFHKYFSIDKPNIEAGTTELIKHFDEFQSFCLDLSPNSVIKGEFNFKIK